MEKELLKTRPYIQDGNRLPFTSLLTFNLGGLIQRIKENFIWENEKLNAIPLIKNNEKSLVLIAVKPGAEIQSVQSDNSVIFQMLEGNIDFYSLNQSIQIKKGQVLAFYQKTKYKLIAREDAVLLLTINKIRHFSLENSDKYPIA